MAILIYYILNITPNEETTSRLPFDTEVVCVLIAHVRYDVHVGNERNVVAEEKRAGSYY